VTSSQKTAKKKKKCAACHSEIPAGELHVVLLLRKAYRGSCATCHRKLSPRKRYHTGCAPVDAQSAMGYNSAVPPTPGAVPPKAPPPKPQTAEDAVLAAFAAFEHAIVIRSQRQPASLTDEVRKQFKTYQGLKARSLRPGTEAEGETAMKIALKRIVDLVF
jgi:hypothetical protein